MKNYEIYAINKVKLMSGSFKVLKTRVVHIPKFSEDINEAWDPIDSETGEVFTKTMRKVRLSSKIPSRIRNAPAEVIYKLLISDPINWHIPHYKMILYNYNVERYRS